MKIDVLVIPEPIVLEDERLVLLKWCAQGIQRDIAAQGKSIAQALRRLGRTIEAGKTIKASYLDGLPEAPERLRKAWDTGYPVLVPTVDLGGGGATLGDVRIPYDTSGPLPDPS